MLMEPCRDMNRANNALRLISEEVGPPVASLAFRIEYVG